MATPIGFPMPFARDLGSTGYLATTTQEIEATYNNLKSLLLTNWGERVGHFYLGCNLIEFLFAPGDDETKERIVQRIESQVAQWLPYVVLNDLSVDFDALEKGFVVKVNFSLRGRQDLSNVLEVPVAPPGA